MLQASGREHPRLESEEKSHQVLKSETRGAQFGQGRDAAIKSPYLRRGECPRPQRADTGTK